SIFNGINKGYVMIDIISLYKVAKKYDVYFEPTQTDLKLWKREVLRDYRGRGYVRALVDFAKSFGLPIKTNPKINSHGFREKMGFQKAQYEMERDFGENPFIWLPEGVQEKSREEHKQ